MVTFNKTREQRLLAIPLLFLFFLWMQGVKRPETRLKPMQESNRTYISYNSCNKKRKNWVKDSHILNKRQTMISQLVCHLVSFMSDMLPFQITTTYSKGMNTLNKTAAQMVRGTTIWYYFHSKSTRAVRDIMVLL